ncbi:T9SS type A sorting domain-containing protein [Adhaeribacter terreus]|uniref:T9SS type A sorting domain-containing protein n=1 Tax=Adhaeribacter terreus TaxID=529703 RepID=A0ABW0E4J6_9BACT
MKNCSTSLLVLQFFLALMFASFQSESFGQESRLRLYEFQNKTPIQYGHLGTRTNWVVSRPGSSMNYGYVSNGWQHNSNSTYIHDSKGNVIERLIQTPTGQNMYQYQYFYDSTGFRIQETGDMWRNNAWYAGDGTRYVLTYDSQGNLTEIILQERKNMGAITWNNKDLHVYGFDNQNREDSYEYSVWNSNLNVWEKKSRITNYLYNSTNKITSYITETYVNSNWHQTYRYTNLAWEKKSGMLVDGLVNFSREIWNNGNWVNESKYSKVYDTNGGFKETIQSFKNGNWANDFTQFVEQDSLFNVIGIGSETWQNGNWVLSNHHKFLHTYSPNQDILETRSQIYQTNTQTYNFNQRWVYSNFQYFSITGIKNEVPQEISVSIYPNPTQNLLNIDLLENTQIVTAQLTDVTGKVILTHHFKASEAKKLNLENLKPGIYLLKLETEKGQTVRKILKN